MYIFNRILCAETDGPDVTFVAGKAVEQTESLGNNLDEDTEAAARKAVREAIAAANKAEKEKPEPKPKEKSEDKEPVKSKDKDDDKDTRVATGDSKTSREDVSASRERGPDGKFVSKEKPVTGVVGGDGKGKTGDSKESSESLSEPDLKDLSKTSLKDILKHREKVAQIKREGQLVKSEMDQAREALARQQAEFQRQVAQYTHAQQQLERERQALASLRNDPARAVREAGWDPEQFILDIANENTPEGRQAREMRELKQQIAAQNEWRRQLEAQYQRSQEEQTYRGYEQARARVVNEFLSKGLDDKKFPHVSNFYKGREKALIAQGDLIADEYKELAGKEGSLDEILEYIEDELATRANSWYTNKQKAEAEAKAKAKATEQETVVTRPSSKGKSLNPNASGERGGLRTAVVDDDEEEDERKENARQAVKAALAGAK